MILPLLAALQREPPGGHGRLDTAMFWVGALLAFTPVVVGLGILGWLAWRGRVRKRLDEDGPTMP